MKPEYQSRDSSLGTRKVFLTKKNKAPRTGMELTTHKMMKEIVLNVVSVKPMLCQTCKWHWSSLLGGGHEIQAVKDAMRIKASVAEQKPTRHLKRPDVVHAPGSATVTTVTCPSSARWPSCTVSTSRSSCSREAMAVMVTVREDDRTVGNLGDSKLHRCKATNLSKKWKQQRMRKHFEATSSRLQRSACWP